MKQTARIISTYSAPSSYLPRPSSRSKDPVSFSFCPCRYPAVSPAAPVRNERLLFQFSYNPLDQLHFEPAQVAENHKDPDPFLHPGLRLCRVSGGDPGRFLFGMDPGENSRISCHHLQLVYTLRGYLQVGYPLAPGPGSKKMTCRSRSFRFIYT